MNRITVKMEDAKEKLYAPREFFDSLNFGEELTNQIYSQNYGFSLEEENLMKRHIKILRAIPINFVIR